MAMSRSGISMRSNSKQVAANIEKKILKLQKESKSVVREVAEFGKHYARTIAPVKSGKTIKAIKWTKGKTPASATIIFGDGHPERMGKINGNGLTTYMNFDKTATTKWSRTPKFITATKDEVWNRFRKKVRIIVPRSLK